MYFDVEFVLKLIPDILKAIPVTLALTVIPILLGMVFGFLVALIRNYKIPVLHQASVLFVSFIRGIPMFVLLFLFFYGLPRLFNLPLKTIPNFVVGLTTLFFYCTAYLSEIIRGALKSVDQHQMEAARSIGMTAATAYRRIIVPQAIMVALPNFFNYTTSLLKNSSLVFGIGIIDIMATAKIAAEKGYRYIEAYTVAAVLYILLGFLFAWIFRRLEIRARKKLGEQV
ncbi:MAG: amino acid ABC transporter permease [Clostridiales Family XIII bacterium]|nr:amino acid ABC transporter permease [Clostridiales Family XIII bacterium]